MIELIHRGNAQDLYGSTYVRPQEIFDAIIYTDSTQNPIAKASFLGWLPMIDRIEIFATVDNNWLQIHFKMSHTNNDVRLCSDCISEAIQELHRKALTGKES